MRRFGIPAWFAMLAVSALTAALAGCAATTMPPPVASNVSRATAEPLSQVTGPLITAVGDIACAPGERVTTTRCRQADTAAQAKGYRPRWALVLGDGQYETGSLSDYRASYAESWGALKSITKPVPGNHEYKTPNAAGYYRYFADQQTGAPGYYSFTVGTWRIYALNSNCAHINCRREARWLARKMSANPTRCSLMTMHHPLYSSGYEHGDSPEGRRFWRVGLRHGTDVALAGHDHDYERFKPMNADGDVTRSGIRSFVVGTGGKSLYTSRSIRAGSVVFDNSRAGVLALRLGRGQYAWKFSTVDGALIDQGTASCH